MRWGAPRGKPLNRGSPAPGWWGCPAPDPENDRSPRLGRVEPFRSCPGPPPLGIHRQITNKDRQKICPKTQPVNSPWIKKNPADPLTNKYCLGTVGMGGPFGGISASGDGNGPAKPVQEQTLNSLGPPCVKCVPRPCGRVRLTKIIDHEGRWFARPWFLVKHVCVELTSTCAELTVGLGEIFYRNVSPPAPSFFLPPSPPPCSPIRKARKN